MGGLGNQLFQYAAGRRLAVARGTELVLDLGWFRHDAPHYATPRTYELQDIPLPVRMISLPPETISRWEGGLRARARRWPSRRTRLPVIRQQDDTVGVDERVLSAPADVVLIGYWQSERYFHDVAETIRADLELPAAPAPRYWALLDAIHSSEAVAVHVRRGDYVTVPRTARFHGSLPTSYYHHAMRRVAERVSARPRVFVFSDDPEWAEEHLSFELPTEHVGRSGWPPAAELRLMASCRHHVIANSSFSWWAAWLAEHPGQVVVTPSAWFRDAAADSSAIVPSRWLRI